MSASANDAVDRAALTLPALTEGAELVGEFKNSGYREPPQLVRLPNGRVVRLPPLLFLVVRALHEHRHLAGGDVGEALGQVAAAVSEQAGARLSAEQIVYLVDRKLAPLGVTTYSDGTPAPVVKPDPFFALRFKVAVFPESFSWFIAGLFAWLFRPVLLAVVIAGFLVSEAWVFTSQSLAEALTAAILDPVSILLVLGLGIASCAFHEVGHAAACRYGGVRPGVMGCGIYLVWPAFYTDISESYRLGRGGRLRADLAGVYFNAIFVVGLTLAYLQTGYAPLVVTVLYVNIQMIQQLLPTLRFDGYYIMADLIGIPDLFKYIGPILRRMFLRRPDPRLDDLKRWPQVFVAAWVLTVVPLLVFQLGLIATQIPNLIAKDWMMIQEMAAAASSGAGPVELIASGLQIFLLLLPLAGLALILYGVCRGLVRWAVRYVRGAGPQPVPDA